MHHIDKVVLVETNPYLLLHLQKSNSYFSWAVGNGTLRLQLVFLLLQETTKLSSKTILK
jgi:hypothetical protein